MQTYQNLPLPNIFDNPFVVSKYTINNEEFSEKLKSELTESKLNNLIASTLGEDWSFEKKFRDFFIWIC